MTRSDIRYALFRCRSGNAEPGHIAVLQQYNPAMVKLKLDLHDFSEEWDINDIAPFDGIVTGGKMMLLHEVRDAPVVDENGNPTDLFVAAATLDVVKTSKAQKPAKGK